MSITKFVLPCVAALSLIACASPQVAQEDRVVAVCGEAEVRTGSMIAKRDRCVDKTPEAAAAAREKGEEMRQAQNMGQVQGMTLKN